MTIRVTIHLSIESFPSLSVNARPFQSRCEQHPVPSLKVRPQEAPVLALLVCASKLHVPVLAWISSPPGQGNAQNPWEKFQLRLCKVSTFLICSPLGARLHQPHTDQVAMSQRGPVRLERHLPCFFGVCEYTCPPPTHTHPSSYLLWLCSYGALNTVPYLTRYLLMLTKCRVSVSQVVVQGTRPSSPSPMSHLLVSAAISRGTCSLVHLSTQAWNL